MRPHNPRKAATAPGQGRADGTTAHTPFSTNVTPRITPSDLGLPDSTRTDETTTTTSKPAIFGGPEKATEFSETVYDIPDEDSDGNGGALPSFLKSPSNTGFVRGTAGGEGYSSNTTTTRPQWTSTSVNTTTQSTRTSFANDRSTINTSNTANSDKSPQSMLPALPDELLAALAKAPPLNGEEAANPTTNPTATIPTHLTSLEQLFHKPLTSVLFAEEIFCRPDGSDKVPS